MADERLCDEHRAEPAAPAALPGDPVPTAHPDHQPVVPPWVGRPWCTCGYVGGNGTDRPLLADHLREFDPAYGSAASPWRD